MKLIMVDLDGTLFDTKMVNYYSYRDALTEFGYNIDYQYYCEYCNGRHYLEFLPKIATTDKEKLKQIHNIKKEKYSVYISKARINAPLIEILKSMKLQCKISLVTTASKENTYNILNYYKLVDLFDLVVTGDDIEKTKPNPEGYIKAMKYFNVTSEESIIFEDSEVGIEAAIKANVQCFVVKGYN